MGVVYKARQVGLNRLVALKMIRSGQDAGPLDLTRFRTEAETIARLQHPNIVQVHDIGERDGRPFVALELVEGGNLAQHLAARPPSPARAAQLVETLARTMHAVHLAGVIHRDLKPANVLLVAAPGGPDAALVPKITDFGLAKVADAAGPTVTGDVLGTPSYMAPEQATGQPAGPFTDVYALGAILYECLTGRPPFRAQAALDVIQQVVNDEPVTPHRLQRGVPADLGTICLKCLEKRPARRYYSALELADDLGRFRAGEPIRARSVSLGGRFVRWARRRPAAAALLAVSLAALVALVTLDLIHQAHLRRALQEARASAEQARERLVRLHVQQGAHYLDKEDWFAALLWFAEALSLDEDRPQRSHAHRLRVGAILARSPRLVQGWSHDGPIRHACFNRAGTRGLTVSDDGTARIWEVHTGRPVTPPLAHGSQVLHGAFSPDGQTVATAAQDGRVRFWLVSTGRPRAEPGRHDGRVSFVAFSPDGRLLLSISDDRTARLWDGVTGKQVTSWRHAGAVTHGAFSPDGARAVTACADGTAQVWDVGTGAALARLLGHRGPVLQVCFHPDGRRVLTAGADGEVRLHDAGTGKQLLGPLKHRAAVVQASFNPDGSRLLTASDDGTARVWSADSGERLLPALRHAAGIASASFGPAGRRIITGGDDNKTRIWDAGTGAPLTPLLRSSGTLRCVALSPDGRWALSAGNDAVADLWDLANVPMPRAEAASGARPPPPSGSGPWRSPDGLRMVTPEGGQSAQVRDSEGRPIGPPLRHGSTVLFAAFSADSERLVTTSDDNTARLWVVRTGASLAQPLRHGSTVLRAAFSADRQLVVTADAYTARVWDAATGEPITPLMRLGGPVREVGFNGEGTEVIVTTASGARRAWELRPDGRPVAELVRLAQVLASARVDPERGMLPLRPEELRDSLEHLHLPLQK
jgi:WD40 repeat protein